MVVTFKRGTERTAGDIYSTDHVPRNICVYVYGASEYIQTTLADQVTVAYQIICCELSQGN